MLVIKTANGLKGNPHTLDDLIELPVTMVEAMDDSYLFVTDLPGLQFFLSSNGKVPIFI